jgi:hypothetical protein
MKKDKFKQFREMGMSPQDMKIRALEMLQYVAEEEHDSADLGLPYALVGGKIFHEHVNSINGTDYAVREAISKDAIAITHGKFERDIIVDAMPKCTMFVNEPDFINYRKIVPFDTPGTRGFNVCYPLHIEPKKGDWSAHEKTLRHTFTNGMSYKGKTGYDFILDWECLLLRCPKEHLPGIILWSKAHGKAGKTSWFRRLVKMLGYNANKIRMADFTNNFNASFADKVLTVIDETEFVDPKTASQLDSIFKNIIDGEFTTVEYKGVDPKPIPNRNHLIMASNLEKPISIGAQDVRWAVFSAPTWEEKDFDALINEKLDEQLPAYLHYLLFEHKLSFEKESRIWFPEKCLDTPAKRAIQEESKSGLFIGFKDAIVDWFINNPLETQKKFHMDHLINFLDSSQIKWYNNQRSVNEMMKNEFGLEKKNTKIGHEQGKGWTIKRDHPLIKKDIDDWKVTIQEEESYQKKITEERGQNLIEWM